MERVTGSDAPAQTRLLMIDAIINLALGVLLVLFPSGVVGLLGIPPAESGFYPNILGGVLLGIGIALLLQYFGSGRGMSGLGLAGAISINLCAGLVLAAWLVWGGLAIPARGHALLWAVVIVVVGLGLIEMASQLRRARGAETQD